MKNVIIILLFLGAVSAILSACYDDKGSYKYGDINDVLIDMPGYMSVQIPLADSLLVEIKPEISQLQLEGEDNLRYLWKRRLASAGEQWQECGHEKKCRLWVKPTDQSDIKLRLTVRDTIQNIESYREIVLNMIFPFSNTWFVLQNINGQAVLGCVDGANSERISVRDVYFQQTGGRFNGAPKMLVANNSHIRPDQDYPLPSNKESILQVFTTTDGWQLDANTMFVRYPYNMLLLGKYTDGSNNYKPEYATSDCAGEVIIDNGTFWFAMANGQSVYYPVKLDAAAGTSYRAAMASAINNTTCYVFDDENKRFLCYSNPNLSTGWWNTKQIRGGNYQLYHVDNAANSVRMTKIGENENALNVFNPDRIGVDQEVVYMGATTDTDASKSIAIARAGSQAHIYEFNVKGLTNDRTPRCSGYFTFSPKGDIKDCHFTSSSYFDRIFFYASGNKIYRVDLNRTVPLDVMIYEYPDASAKISMIDFCSNRRDIGYDVSPTEFVFRNINKILGVAVNKADGNSSLLEIKLTGGGEVAKDGEGMPIVYEFEGFKDIVDIKFMYK